MMSDNDTFTPQINYELLVESALRNVVRSSLEIAEQDDLPGDAHFYITFLTEYPGVDIPKPLKDNHPERMTIVLQHQFWELDVRDDDFSVGLSFGGIRQNLTVPFMSIIDFSDPSVGFSLQFALEGTNDDDDTANEAPSKPETIDDQQAGADQVGADVVSLDTFRKKT
jgi:hypothetical protein